MRYLLDSDTCIFALRDFSNVIDRLYSLDPSEWAMSSVTAFELLRGLHRNARADVVRQTEEFVAASTVLNFGLGEARYAARIESTLAAMGKPSGRLDVLIAAQALKAGLTLVTNNTKHFENVPGLKLENWV